MLSADPPVDLPERSSVTFRIPQQCFGAREIPDQGSEDRLAREPPQPDSLRPRSGPQRLVVPGHDPGGGLRGEQRVGDVLASGARVGDHAQHAGAVLEDVVAHFVHRPRQVREQPWRAAQRGLERHACPEPRRQGGQQPRPGARGHDLLACPSPRLLGARAQESIARRAGIGDGRVVRRRGREEPVEVGDRGVPAAGGEV